MAGEADKQAAAIEMRAVFFRELRRTGSLPRAAAAAGVSDRTARRWRSQAPDAWDELSLRGVPTNLLRSTSSFVGRTRELADLGARLDSGARLVTLAGPPGIGKSRLAAELAWRQLPVYGRDGAGGVWSFDAGQATDRGALASVVTAALGTPAGDPGPVHAEQLGDQLSVRGPLLIVIDNFDGMLQQSAATLSRWLAVAPELRLVVTSRERVRLKAEWVYEVRSLDTVDARRLFAERAEAASGRIPNERDAHLVTELLRHLDCNPLAIELAAAWMDTLSLHDLVSRLEQWVDILRDGTRDGPQHHRSFAAAIEWSWDRLSDDERTVLAHCSVFRGGFSLDAASAVVARIDADALFRHLASLRRKHLVSRGREPRSTGEVRFYLSTTMRAYARTRLGEHRAAAERRHLAYYAGACERSAPMHLDDQNLIAARTRAMNTEPVDVRAALQVTLALARLRCDRKEHAVARDELRAVLSHPAAGELEPELRARAIEASEAAELDRHPLEPTGAVTSGLTSVRSGAWFRPPSGETTSLRRRRSLQLVFAGLILARLETPPRTLAREDLFELGWPGERALPRSATKRIHSALTELRALGLRGLLIRRGGGYCLDPSVPLILQDEPTASD